MTTAYGELADELLRLADALRAGTLAPVPMPADEAVVPVESDQPDDDPRSEAPSSMVSAFLESLGGITAYVLVASGVLVVVFNVAFRLFPPIR